MSYLSSCSAATGLAVSLTGGAVDFLSCCNWAISLSFGRQLVRHGGILNPLMENAVKHHGAGVPDGVQILQREGALTN